MKTRLETQRSGMSCPSAWILIQLFVSYCIMAVLGAALLFTGRELRLLKAENAASHVQKYGHVRQYHEPPP